MTEHEKLMEFLTQDFTPEMFEIMDELVAQMTAACRDGQRNDRTN